MINLKREGVCNCFLENTDYRTIFQSFRVYLICQTLTSTNCEFRNVTRLREKQNFINWIGQ